MNRNVNVTLERAQEANQKEMLKKTKVHDAALRVCDITRRDLKKTEGLTLNKLKKQQLNLIYK